VRNSAIAFLLLALTIPSSSAQQSLKVRVWSAPGYRLVDLPLEKYVAAVLAGESSVFQSGEATKAMAVAARTYGLKFRGRHASEGFDLCATTHCQRIDLAAVTPRLQDIADATAGELLWFQGKLALTPYTGNCGGRTEDVSAVWPGIPAPYLKSHDDPNCVRAGSSAWRWAGDPGKIVEALRRSGLRTPEHIGNIAIARRSPSGRAAELLLEGDSAVVRISASTFRFAMGRELGWNTVRSEQYDAHAVDGQIVFAGRGAGHGVGLCQRGAGQMGVDGRSYREILAFYYPGAEVGTSARGFSWTRLGGGAIALFTTQPAQDGVVLAAAEREFREAAKRTNWIVPAGLELRVYPDVESFRNATGEPGWVAAYTQGRRIHLQPAAVLRNRGVLEKTLRHEFWHVLVESQAAPGLSLWFREGLAEYLTAPIAGGGTARTPSDADLRATKDAASARRAYADAARAVSGLVKQYGEAAVLGWVATGLPASVSQPRTADKPPIHAPPD
jgi:stage II sporulation protein D